MQIPSFKIIFCGISAGFFLLSKILFDQVYLTSNTIIDEEFHIPQGLAYCNFRFKRWDSKITTLPGLYLVSTLLLGPFNLCSIYWLRCVNLIASVINLWLFYICFGLYTKHQPWVNLLSSINLSLLPPLYFFNHVYYTDVISLTFILLLVICHKKGKHLMASFFGLMSVLMRQTNIIWLLMVFGEYSIKEIAAHSRKQPRKRTDYDDDLSDIIYMIWCLKNGKALKKFSIKVWLNIAAYSAVVLSFVVFVIMNGSIVVGDKNAHMASLHLPQLLYFCLFCFVFAWPYFVVDVLQFVKISYGLARTVAIVTVCVALIIFLNTLEHPYLLADNRHYTFYIWNRFYGRYFWFRYIMIPVYYLGFFSSFKKIYTRYNAPFALIYVVCTALVLIPQKMIEIRYFLVPYILLRLQFRNIKLWQLVAELSFHFMLNVVTFYIFFNKDIYWSNFTEVQKLIW